ncbi:sugar kinase [Streptococcus iniae]|uniref:2-keto-3-deoxygluconate kinase n=2 Tax=Streptococcus iniae TaxID=1346 RepID=A0ABM5QFN7_STRIN|nr:sugar kinase [Streptococcus iniae]AGM98012.1 carbohydrate kinase, PfkB family [Streptococcus iniae SF1]AHY15087.1 2-keto-3-deoxygluconate kinase [Streptococcus iniae]AHY16957.1 2-keto-3-deoxygluconate kinase [Streptococcus iniae]AJG25273.1 2-keto-3-deoxygluconate kinase [Streptococcus iniae]APD31147.1 2-keto-3-deoxygluconate kinase [Streptococcus iniae]
MPKILFFGEALMRLSPQDKTHLSNAETCQLFFGGTEVNVARALEGMGQETRLLTCLPNTRLGQNLLTFLEQNKIDTQFIQKSGERLGLYFLENAFGCRQAFLDYDRKHSSIHNLCYDKIDLDALFDDVSLFHFSGITLSLSKDIQKISHLLLEEAQKRGIKISFDLNYRRSLLAADQAKKLFSEFASYADICFGIEPLMANASDLTFFKREQACEDDIESRMLALMETFHFEALFHTHRHLDSFGRNHYKAYMLSVHDGFITSQTITTPVLERVGSGDAFVAGALYQLLQTADAKRTVDFAVASASLKCTLKGDNMFESPNTISKVLNLAQDIIR